MYNKDELVNFDLKQTSQKPYIGRLAGKYITVNSTASQME